MKSKVILAAVLGAVALGSAGAASAAPALGSLNGAKTAFTTDAQIVQAGWKKHHWKKHRWAKHRVCKWRHGRRVCYWR